MIRQQPPSSFFLFFFLHPISLTYCFLEIDAFLFYFYILEFPSTVFLISYIFYWGKNCFRKSLRLLIPKTFIEIEKEEEFFFIILVSSCLLVALFGFDFFQFYRGVVVEKVPL